MSGSKKGNFSFRMSADDANAVVNEFRKVAQGSDQLKAAFDRLIQASPQLASVNDNVQRKMRDTADAMQKTGAAARDAQAPMAQMGSSFLTGGILGAGLASGIHLFERLRQSAADAMKAIPEAGDAAQQAVARLTALTGSRIAGLEAYSRIREIAATTGSTLDDTVNAFQRFRVAANDLGATSAEVFKFIENLQKFSVVNGLSGQAATAATIQLGQALASGRLNGDELKSILENMPQLAQGLARELGVSVGRLREMGTEGKLSADVVWPAIQRAVSGVGEQFDKMPASIGRARNEMDVAAKGLLESLDQAFGLSGRVVATFQRLAGIMTGIAGTVRGITQDQGQLVAAQDRNRLRDEVAGLDATIAEASAVSNPDRDAIAQLVQRRDQAARILAEKDAEIRREQQRASEAAHAATLARTGQQIQEILDLDKKAAADKELAARKKVIFDRFVATGDAEEMDRATALAVKDHADALEKLKPKAERATAAVRDHTEATAEFLKSREKIDAAARAVEMALDPYAQAWQKAAEQVEALTKAMELWEDTQGAMGLDPEKGPALMARITDGLTETYERLGRAGEKTDSTFQQFFANATSGFEDAIVRGERFGDVLKGLQQDISRMLLRSFVTGPASDAIGGWMKDQGGLTGLLKSGITAIGSLFADGGVMTDRGPLPLRRYASGGIADTPQLAMFGEGRTPEAYVPLPDGRRIPVAMQGGGRGSTTINVNVAGSNASPQLIAATVALAVDESQRRIYGDADRGGAAAKKLGRRR